MYLVLGPEKIFDKKVGLIFEFC